MERIAEVSIIAYDNGKCHGTTHGEPIDVLACLVNIVEELAEIFPCECICDAVKVGIEGANEENFKILDELCSSASKQTEQPHQFRAGDRVRFKTWEQMEKEFGLDENGDIRTIARFSKLRKHLCGTFATIDSLTGSYVGLRVFSAQEEDHYLCTLDMIEPSPYFHGKVVCVKSNENALTVGKIYEVNDGRIKVGENCYFPTFLSEPIKTLSELNVHRSLQFVEVKDE